MSNTAEDPKTLCTRCHVELREPNQRWGRGCLTRYQKERRRLERARRAQSQGPRYEWAKCQAYGCEYLAATRTAAYCCNGHGSAIRWHSPDCRRRRKEPR